MAPVKRQKLEVIPRYTAGSPAMVDSDTGMRVAAQEKQFIQYFLEGSYGEADKAKAERLGLDCIVLENLSTASKQRYHDVLTGKDYVDVPYGCIRNDPETIVTQIVNHKARYFYRRTLVFTGKAIDEFSGADMYRVLTAIKNLFQESCPPPVDPLSQEAMTLWNSRKRA